MRTLPAIFVLLPLITLAQPQRNPPDLKHLLADVSSAYAKLEPQSIRPAEGFIKYDYLIPAGYYKQMWDWDGFFIGVHLADQSRGKAKYLKYWVLNFADAIDQDGYVAGRVTTEGPQPLMGKFAMKPFLAQGAVIASERLGDYGWVAPIWGQLQRIIAYREKTQFDPKWGLFFWNNAIQSGADNNVALTNDPKDQNAILAVDLCTFQFREYKAMAWLAEKLGKQRESAEYHRKAEALRAAMLKHLWFEKDEIFFNIRRDNGEPVRRVTYSDFVPLIEDILPQQSAKAMIRRYLLSPDQMWAPYGIRSLSKRDPDYNNVSMIKPYSNWQGPIWINANYLDFIALRRYGFNEQASLLAAKLGRMVLADIKKWGSMHECYDAETGEGLAPTPEQSPNHVFTGFVGWDLLVQDMLECEVKEQCPELHLPDIGNTQEKSPTPSKAGMGQKSRSAIHYLQH
ncbi:MAG: trehalase family glycosidase [Terriglobia bacterium]|jgi:alpha,alpha-trehalase|nr:trehalase family glycosidase [Terriglobia bacterium]